MPDDCLNIQAELPRNPAFARVLIVSHSAEMGGAEQGLIDLARHLGPGRCEVVLLADGHLHEILKKLDIPVRLMEAGRSLLGVRRAGGALRAVLALPRAVILSRKLAALAGQGTLLYANSQKAAFVAMLAGAGGGPAVIWHLHDILSADHFGWPQRRLLATLSNRLTRAVIVVSSAARDAYVASGGRRDKARIIYNGIDPRPYAGLPETPRRELRAALGLPDGKLVGLFGRITEWKGQRVLIEAMRDLPHIHALIVGSPMFGQDAEADHLKDLVRRYGLQSRVHFLGYRIDGPALMRAVDLVVHCSTSPEPFGRVIVEALLAGTPILAAESGASREILGDSDWVVQPGGPSALAAAIRRLFAQGETEQLIQVRKLRARMAEHFLVDRMIRDIRQVIEEAA